MHTFSFLFLNKFSLEELCRSQYSLKYFFRSHVDHQTYGKTLTVGIIAMITHALSSNLKADMS